MVCPAEPAARTQELGKQPSSTQFCPVPRHPLYTTLCSFFPLCEGAGPAGLCH